MTPRTASVPKKSDRSCESPRATMMPPSVWLLAALAVLPFLTARPAVAAEAEGDKPVAVEPARGDAKWEKTIAEFERRDAEAPPPKGAILFVGSSSVRMWDTDKWFPDLVTINRGFGGSTIADVNRYARRIVLPYAPRLVVFYAGDNDVAGGRSPEGVEADFRAFMEMMDAELPATEVIFVCIKPSRLRWNLAPKMRQANERIKAMATAHPRLTYLDIDAPMIGADGKPSGDLFIADGLHLSEKGYDMWSRLLRPHLGASDADRKDAPER